MRREDNLRHDLFVKPIEEIRFEMNCKYEMIPILKGLIYLYHHRPELKKKVLRDLVKNGSLKLGRKGMDAWRVLCLYVVRRGTKYDYEALSYHTATDEKLREVLLVGAEERFKPSSSTIQENLSCLSIETIQALNESVIEIAIERGYENGKYIRGDTFVCEATTHYPTDNGLLFDCGKSLIRLSRKIQENGWRQCKHLQRKLRTLSIKIGKIRHSRKKEKEYELKKAYRQLLKRIKYILSRSYNTKGLMNYLKKKTRGKLRLKKKYQYYEKLERMIALTEQVIELTERRVLRGEQIPSREKIFSVYEEHVELINRGKYPNPVEFGHKIFVNQGKSGFILDYDVMEPGLTDANMLKPSLERLKRKYGFEIEAGSYDKGFYYKKCYEDVGSLMDIVVIAKKGKRNKNESERENTKQFKKLRKWRSGIESLISCLIRGNGLNRCVDKGMNNYKKFVAGCILARNLQTLGSYIIVEEKKRFKKIG